MNYLKAFLLSLLVVFMPIWAALIAVLSLVVVDFIAGVLAAYKRKEAITISKVRNSVVKLLTYETTMMITYLAEHFLIGHSLPVFKIVSGMIGMVELTSILSSLNQLSGDNLLKVIIDRLNPPKP